MFLSVYPAAICQRSCASASLRRLCSGVSNASVNSLFEHPRTLTNTIAVKIFSHDLSIVIGRPLLSGGAWFVASVWLQPSGPLCR